MDALFFVGLLMFFSDAITLRVLITYGTIGASYVGIGIAISGIGLIFGPSLLMITCVLLFRNRRMR